MPFHLSPLGTSPASLHEFAVLDDLAMRDTPTAMAMEREAQLKGTTRLSIIEGFMHDAFAHDDPQSEWVQITDEETGQMAAAANWRLENGVDQAENKKYDEERAEKEAPQTLSLFAAGAKEWALVRNEFFPNQAHLKLVVLVVHPDFQRRGAGSMLVEYGCRRADELGVIAVLGASDKGKGLYLKHGFKIIKEQEFELRPFGFDSTETKRSMMRMPIAKT